MNHSRNWKLGLAGALAFALVLLVAPSPRPPPPLPSPLEAPVLLQEGTTADAGQALNWVMLGTIPAPDKRQLKEAGCKQSLGQFVINGACWQRLPVPPPCPAEDGAFEHEDHRCYVRVLRAEKAPTSGGGAPQGVADP